MIFAAYKELHSGDEWYLSAISRKFAIGLLVTRLNIIQALRYIHYRRRILFAVVKLSQSVIRIYEFKGDQP